MNLIEIQNKIISEKIKLRKKSKNFVNNFKKIEKYIQKEVTIIKESKDTIIPEIEFEDISIKNQTMIKDKVFNRGCVIIRNVFDKKKVKKLNEDLDKYVLENNYFEDQKKKIGIDISTEPKQTLENTPVVENLKKDEAIGEKKSEVSKLKKETSVKKPEVENKLKK